MSSTASEQRPVSLVDAVCCVHFCAAGRSQLLLDLLTKLNMEILIPAEVDKEVLKNSKYPGLKSHWPKFKQAPNVRVLPKLEADDEDQPEVVATVARIRGVGAARALKMPNDLGEVVVIAHAVHLRKHGRDVRVLIDDQGGQQLAEDEGLDVVTIEVLLMAGVDLGIITPAQLRKTYEQLIPYGGGLPSWDASEMKKLYAQWKRDRRAAATASSSTS